MNNEEKLQLLCKSYLRLIAAGLAGDQARRVIHEKIKAFTGLPDCVLKKILHNLDRYIGYDPESDWIYLDLEHTYPIRLSNLLMEKMVESVKSDGDAMEFLESEGFDTAEDWLEYWKYKEVP